MEAIQMDKAMFLSKVMDFEAGNKKWKYLGDKPCIIDFYADWCNPCKIVAPTLEEIASEYKGKLYVYKIDAEKEETLSTMFSVRSIPSILFVPMKGKPRMKQGALPKTYIKEAIENILQIKEPQKSFNAEN